MSGFIVVVVVDLFLRSYNNSRKAEEKESLFSVISPAMPASHTKLIFKI